MWCIQYHARKLETYRVHSKYSKSIVVRCIKSIKHFKFKVKYECSVFLIISLLFKIVVNEPEAVAALVKWAY